MERTEVIKKFNIAFFLIGFITFSGFYLVLAFGVKFGLGNVSRILTVPLKLVNSFLMIYCLYYMHNLLNFKLSIRTLIYTFFAFYTVRLFHDAFLSDYSSILSKSPSNYLLYWFSSGIIPFLFFSSIHVKHFGKSLIIGIITSTILLMIFTLSVYDYQTGTRAKGVDFDTISPLALSYTSIITIGYGLIRIFLFNRQYLINLLIVMISVPTFLYGASKGSFLALGISVLFIFVAKRGFTGTIIGLIVIFIGVNVILNLDLAISRRINYSLERHETGEKEAREMLWDKAITNTLESPFIGDFIEVRGVEFMGGGSFHPHNIIIESFMSLGFFGGIIFVIIILKAVLICVQIIRLELNLFWVPLIFMQSLVQNMISGSIWGGMWFWSSLGLVVSSLIYLKTNK